MQTLTKETIERLATYPELNKLVREFIETDGECPLVDGERVLPHFVHWLKLRLLNDSDNGKMRERTGWDEDADAEFYSWGHNSRWANVFWPWVESNLKDAVNLAMDINDSATKDDRDLKCPAQGM